MPDAPTLALMTSAEYAALTPAERTARYEAAIANLHARRERVAALCTFAQDPTAALADHGADVIERDLRACIDGALAVERMVQRREDVADNDGFRESGIAVELPTLRCWVDPRYAFIYVQHAALADSWVGYAPCMEPG
jgi:hypothetical protein